MSTLAHVSSRSARSLTSEFRCPISLVEVDVVGAREVDSEGGVTRTDTEAHGMSSKARDRVSESSGVELGSTRYARPGYGMTGKDGWIREACAIPGCIWRRWTGRRRRRVCSSKPGREASHQV